MSPLALSLRLAAVTTLWLLALGLPLAWWLARTRWKGKPLLEALVALPLVLPPTVLGFYLLLLLSPRGPVGRLWVGLGGEPLVFSRRDGVADEQLGLRCWFVERVEGRSQVRT